MKTSEFKVIDLSKRFYMKSDEYLNGWAKHCGWKATLVYDSLCRHADRYREAFPSVKLMAEEHGVSYNTIKRGVKTLEEFGIILIKKKRNPKGKFLSNTYFLLSKDNWKLPMAPTEPRSSMAPTGNTHGPHRPTKGTQYKGTKIINNAPGSKPDIVENLLEESNGESKIQHSYQYLGLEIFEKTVAPKNKRSECIRIAKVYPQGVVMSALSFSADYPNPSLKWKMFLWKLNSLLKDSKKNESSNKNTKT